MGPQGTDGLDADREGGSMSEQPHSLQYAKHQPDLLLTSGLFTTRWKIRRADADLASDLFRTLRKGERERGKLDITRENGAGQRIRFIGFEPLDPWDQRLLTGLIAVAGVAGQPLNAVEAETAGNPLSCTGAAMKWRAITAACSLGGLLRGIGLEPTGPAYRRAIESLTRLENVTVIFSDPLEPGQPERRRSSFNLLKFEYDPGQRSDLRFTLNPLLTVAIYAKNGGFTRLEMAEMRAIKRDAALKLWHRLCAGINAGEDGKFNIETLAGYIYHDYDDADRPNRRKYRARAREALREITEAAGWKATEYAAGKYLIARPETKGKPAALPPVALMPAGLPAALPAVAA